jgi:hypothetical protein
VRADPNRVLIDFNGNLTNEGPPLLRTNTDVRGYRVLIRRCHMVACCRLEFLSNLADCMFGGSSIVHLPSAS